MQKVSIPVFLLTLAVFVLGSACKTTKPTRPMEQYDENPFEEQISTLNIPIKVGVEELENMLNKQFEGVVYEDNDMDDGDDMMVKAEKQGEIKLSIDSSFIKYKIPLKLWIKYDAGFTTLQGEGAINVEMKTLFDIAKDWNLSTQTEIVGHEWIEQPKLKMGVVSLPVGTVANLLLNNFKSTITEKIDEQIKENFKMSSVIAEAWENAFQPVLVAPDFNTWLMINPEKIGMTPIRTTDGKISTTIAIQSRPRLKIGGKPTVDKAANSLPPFQYVRETKDDFEIQIGAEIGYKEAERLVKENMVGEQFDYGKRSIKVEDIELYGQGNKLVINTKLSGSYEGNIFLTGKPEYNARHNAIDIKSLKYTVDSRNFLLRSAAWLLKGKFKNSLEENLNFYLDDNLTEIKEQIREQLKGYQVADNVMLKGDLRELNLSNAYLSPDAIQVSLKLDGQVEIEMTELKKLEEEK